MAWYGDNKRGRIAVFLGNRPSMVGAFQLNGNSRDNSGNGHNGTDTSMSYGVKGKWGLGAYFNGSANIQSSSPIINSGTVMSVSLWLYSLSESQSQDVTIFTNQQDTNNFGLIFSRNTATANSWGIFYGNGSGSWITYNANFFTIPGNKWHHFYCVVNGTSAKVYMNGVLIISYTGGSNANFANCNNFMIGSDTYGGATGRGFNGYIDDVAVFNEELPAPLISQYYAWATRKRRVLLSESLKIALAFTKTMSDSIMNAASRTATVSRLAAFTRTPSDSIMNAASRLATLAKGLVRTMSDSIMNAVSRTASVARLFGAIRAPSDSVLNGASRSATLSRSAVFIRTLSDSITNAASRFATLAKGLARSLADSFMNADSRFASVARIFGAVRSPSDSVLNGASRTTTVSRLAAFTRILSDSITNGASRFATVTRLRALMRSMSDSFMAAKGRITVLKAFVDGLLIQFSNKYNAQGTTFTDKYTKQNTDFENKYQ